MAVVMTWQEFALFGVLVAYLFIVLRYMIASMINNAEMKSRSLLEIQSIIFTLILFATFSVYDNTVSISNAKATVTKYYDTAFDIYKGVTVSISVLSLLSSFGVQMNLGSFLEKHLGGSASDAYAGIMPFSILSPLITSFSYFQSFLGISFINLQFHIRLLDIMATTGKTILFPLGIFLRAFKITRNGGNVLIALFVAFYIIYPITIDFMDLIITEKYSSCTSPDLYKLGNLLFNELKKTSWFSMPDIASVVQGGDALRDHLKGLTKDICKYNNDPNLIGSIVINMGLKGIFSPFFALFVSLGFARVFAGILGTEVDFSALIRVV